MQILSNGFKLPETGDFGDSWFPAMEDNVQQLNDHTHDGVDSEKIASTGVEAVSSSILSGSFVDQGNGYWRALLTLPVGASYDTMTLVFRDPTSGEAVLLRHEKVSASTAYVYTNFVQNFTAVFVA
jgi:hypothetical protein